MFLELVNQQDLSKHNWQIVLWDEKYQIKQTNKDIILWSPVE